MFVLDWELVLDVFCLKFDHAPYWKDKLDSRDMTLLPFVLRTAPGSGQCGRPLNYPGWLVCFDSSLFIGSALAVQGGNRIPAEVPCASQLVCRSGASSWVRL